MKVGFVYFDSLALKYVYHLLGIMILKMNKQSYKSYDVIFCQ